MVAPVFARLFGGIGGLAKDSAKLGAATFLSRHGGIFGQAASMGVLGHNWQDIRTTVLVGLTYQAFQGTGVIGNLVQVGVMKALTRSSLKNIEDEIKKAEVTRVEPNQKNEPKDLLGLIQKIDKKHVDSVNQVRQAMQKTNTYFYKITQEHTKGFEKTGKHLTLHQQHLDKLERDIRNITTRLNILGGATSKLQQSSPLKPNVYDSNQKALPKPSNIVDADYEEIKEIFLPSTSGKKALPSPQNIGKVADKVGELAFKVPLQRGGGALQNIQKLVSGVLFSMPSSMLAGFAAGTLGGLLGSFIGKAMAGGGGMTDLPKQVDWTPDYFNLRVKSNIFMESSKDIIIRGKNVTIRADNELRLIGGKIIGGPGTGGTGSGRGGLNTTHTPGKVGTGIGSDMIGEPDNRSRFEAMKDRAFGRTPSAAPDTTGSYPTYPGGSPTPGGMLPSPRTGGPEYNIPGLTPQPSFPTDGPISPETSLNKGKAPFSGIQTPSTPSIDYGQGSQIPGFMGRQPIAPGTQGGLLGTTGTAIESGELTPGAMKIRRDLPVIQGVPASIRYNNPGAQYPSLAAEKYGMTSYGIIGGGHKIAQFPTRVHGLAANMDNFNRGYVGLTLEQAKSKWRDDARNGASPMPAGFDPSKKLTKEMLHDPNFMVPWMKAMSKHEAGKHNPITDDEYKQAHEWFKQGGIKGATGSSGGNRQDQFNPKMSSTPGTALDFSQSTPKSLLPDQMSPSMGPWSNFHRNEAWNPKAPSPDALKNTPESIISDAMFGKGDPRSLAVDRALTMRGLHEQKDREVVKQYLAKGGAGMDPAQIAWCAAFVNSTLQQEGIQGTTGPSRMMARSFHSWGDNVRGDPQKGDVMVKGSHVGIFTGITRQRGGRTEYQMVSGNSADKVQETWHGAGEYQFRRASDKELGKLGEDKNHLQREHDKEAASKFPWQPLDPEWRKMVGKDSKGMSALQKAYEDQTGKKAAEDPEAFKAWHDNFVKNLPGISVDKPQPSFTPPADFGKQQPDATPVAKPDTRSDFEIANDPKGRGFPTDLSSVENKVYPDGTVRNRAIETQRDILNRAYGERSEETQRSEIGIPGKVVGTDKPYDKVPYANPFHPDSKIQDATAIPKPDMNEVYPSSERIFDPNAQDQSGKKHPMNNMPVHHLGKDGVWREYKVPGATVSPQARAETLRKLKEHVARNPGQSIEGMPKHAWKLDNKIGPNAQEALMTNAQNYAEGEFRGTKTPNPNDLKPADSSPAKKDIQSDSGDITKGSSEELNKQIDRQIETRETSDQANDIKDPRHSPETKSPGVSDNGYGSENKGKPDASD